VYPRLTRTRDMSKSEFGPFMMIAVKT